MIQKLKRIPPHLIIFLFSAAIWLFPVLVQPDSIPFHPKATSSDLLVSHWPNLFFVRSELAKFGTLPLWNPLILSGAPLAADPLFGIWYPPNWIAFVLPMPLALNLLFWLHLFWAGMGFYKFMRADGYSKGSAIVAGLAFCGTPKLIGHISLGHLSLVAAVAWTPWVLLAARKALKKAVLRQPGYIAWLAGLGAILGLIFLIDPRWVLPLAGLTAAYIGGVVLTRRELLQKRTVGAAITVLAFALGIAAVLALPLIEFTSRSTRIDLTIAEAGAISLPIQDLLGLILPPLGGSPETIVFVGISALGLALVAALTNARGWRFWAAVFIVSIVIALGSQTPLNALLARIIPGFRYLRVPARFLFISSFALAVLSGIGLERIVRKSITPQALRPIRLGTLSFWGVVLLLGIVILVGVNLPAGMLMIFSALASMALLSLIGKSILSPDRQAMFWGMLLLAELFMLNRSLLESRSAEELFQKSFQLPRDISQASVNARIFSPSYSLPQHVAVLEQIQLADGINPLQLRSYWEFMADTVGFDGDTYSVTLPPFPDGDPSSPQVWKLDSVRLGILNIGTILSAYPLENQGLQYQGQENGNYTYANPDLRPRAWVEPAGTEGSGAWREVEAIRLRANQINLTAIGPGLLVLSELAYPGWEASIDGDKTQIKPYLGLLRSVDLDVGMHEIRFQFRPASVYIGLSISLFTLLFLAVMWRKK